MIGYHLTAFRNYANIKRKGLVPYLIKDHQDKFFPYIKPPVLGIWVWKDRLDEASENMSVAWHCGKKKINKVVVLSVEYTLKDIWTVIDNGEPKTFAIKHYIDWDVRFNENSEAILLRYRIPPERVDFVKAYDWSKYIRIEEDYNAKESRSKSRSREVRA